MIGAAAPLCGPADPLAVGDETGAAPDRKEVPGAAPGPAAARRLEGAV